MLLKLACREQGEASCMTDSVLSEGCTREMWSGEDGSDMAQRGLRIHIRWLSNFQIHWPSLLYKSGLKVDQNWTVTLYLLLW